MNFRMLCLSVIALLVLIGIPSFGDEMVTNEITQEVEVDSVAVVFHGKELFEVHGISSISAEARVERLEKRLRRQAASPLVDTDDMAIFHDDELHVSIIMIEGEMVAAVWDSDGERFNKSRQELAEERLLIIKGAIDQYRKDHTAASYIKGGVLAIVTTLVYALIWYLVNLLKRKEIRFIESKFAGQKMLKLLDGDSIVSINGTIMRLIAAIVMITVFIFYLNLMFSFFPWTFNLSAKLFDLISTPIIRFWKGFVDNLPNLFALLVIGMLTHFVLRSIKHIFLQIAEGKVRIRGFYQDWAETTYTLIRMVIVVFAAVVAFPFIPGSGSPAFKGISIFMGVLVSLGSSSAVGNIFGGLVLTYMRSFMPGDFVEINSMQGTVMSRRTFSTRLKTRTNEIISIPNAAVAANPIINFSKMTKSVGVNIGSEVTIGYDIPCETVKELLLKSATGVQDVLKEPAPKVLILGLDDFYVRYKIIVSTKNPAAKFLILTSLHEHILQNFAEAKVEIMSPHYQANRSGEDITIPGFEQDSAN